MEEFRGGKCGSRAPQWEQKKARVAECSKLGKKVVAEGKQEVVRSVTKASKTRSLEFTLRAVKTSETAVIGGTVVIYAQKGHSGARSQQGSPKGS